MFETLYTPICCMLERRFLLNGNILNYIDIGIYDTIVEYV